MEKKNLKRIGAAFGVAAAITGVGSGVASATETPPYDCTIALPLLEEAAPIVVAGIGCHETTDEFVAEHSEDGGTGNDQGGDPTLPPVPDPTLPPVPDPTVPPMPEPTPIPDDGTDVPAPGDDTSTPGPDDGTPEPAPAPGDDTGTPGDNGPGNSDDAPGHDPDGPGNSEDAPGHDPNGPGNSENAPGGNGGNSPVVALEDAEPVAVSQDKGKEQLAQTGADDNAAAMAVGAGVMIAAGAGAMVYRRKAMSS